MVRLARSKLVVVMLSLNAALLLFVVSMLISRGEFMPSAMAQLPSQVSSSQDMIVVPGQLSGNVWGCYVMDTRTQTMCIYQYNPGEKLLRLQAARGIEHDLQLRSFNTLPLPVEVAELVQKERSLKSGVPSTVPSSETKK